MSILRSCDSTLGKAFQIRSSTERITLSPKDCDICRVIGIEGKESLLQCVGMIRVDGISKIRARLNYGHDAITAFNTNRHIHLPQKNPTNIGFAPHVLDHNSEHLFQGLALNSQC
jgi:hypothetical protein